MLASFLIFVEAVAIAVIAVTVRAKRENPVNREASLPWHEYNFVTIDRKHRFIITHKTDPTVGFEARLPNDELFEQYLAFLRTVLPAHVIYTEKRWKWSLI